MLTLPYTQPRPCSMPWSAKEITPETAESMKACDRLDASSATLLIAVTQTRESTRQTTNQEQDERKARGLKP